MTLAARDFESIDWEAWTPAEQATLLFVVNDDRVLLIRKKRGIGAGKINGPGGRVDQGEGPMEAAVREVEEELRVTPIGVTKVGEILFQVLDGVSIHIHVFRGDDCLGEPTETPEAIPLWTPLDAIPFDHMWEDDRLWFPRMLSGPPFEMRTLFDGDRMLGHDLRDMS
jgi:8-oxo-dGTP diphosphatase